jgi:heme a synthase
MAAMPGSLNDPSGSAQPWVRGGSPAALARWLVAVACIILVIVAVGGITRLTESGLSITQWKPVTGTLPPLTEAQWRAEFAAYQTIPEYVRVSGPAGMTLAEYKFIYFWEWFHRLLARVVGLAYALPLAWFWLHGAIPRGYRLRLVLLLALGGMQGLFGWLMVRSGVNDAAQAAQRTDVSHFWLSAHLLTALVTLALIVWTVCDLRRLVRNPAAQPARPPLLGWVTGGALLLQLLLGAWVAGLNAGYVGGSGWFNWDAWPLMQGSFFPEGIDWRRGAICALTHDPFLLHFLHRWWAWVVVALLVLLARRARAAGRQGASIAVHCAFGIQILLGISTVMSGIALWLGVLHQLVGALLVVACAWAVHVTGRRG